MTPHKPTGGEIPEAVVIAALETVLKPLGTSLRHYMPTSKAAAIEAMRGVLAAQDAQSRERSAGIVDDTANAVVAVDELSAIGLRSIASAIRGGE